MNLQKLRNDFPAAPEYLTQIFLLERDHGIVPNAQLADRLGVSRPAVSQAVGRLKKLGLVNQKRYGAIALSVAGRDVAEKVVKRHFLLEHLLVGVLDYPWDKSDEDAAELQASLSDDLTEHLDARLGYPQTCPHGNPMPGSDIQQKYLNAPSLIDAEAGSKVKIIRITEEGEMTPGMLPFCQKHGISPGKVVTVEKQEDEGTLCSDGATRTMIPADYAARTCWEPAGG